LTTLAQSLQAGAQYSSVGSRVNVTV
jgi:hypothetical protein